MKAHIVQNANETFLYNANGSAVHENDRVFVRVVDVLSKDSYLVSLSGTLVKTVSSLPLSRGDAFFARVSFQNGNLIVKTENGASLSLVQNAVERLSDLFQSDGTIVNETLKNFFSSLGLPNDFFSFALLSVFKNLSMKFDAKLFQKIKTLSMQFEEDEQEAQDFAAAFFHKSGMLSKSAVKHLLDFSRSGERKFADKHGANDSGADCGSDKQNKHEIFFEIKDEIKNFFFSLFWGRAYAQNAAQTLACFFNHTGFSKEKNLVVLPFAFKSENDKRGSGKFSLYLDTRKRTLEKMLLFAKTEKNAYGFALYFSEKRKRILCAFQNDGEKLFSDFKNFVKNDFPAQNILIEKTDLRMLSSVSDIANEFECVRADA